MMKQAPAPVASPRPMRPGGAGDSVATASLLNALARSFEALVNLVTVPVLLRHLGVEAYGVIGFTQAVFAVLGVLDFGFGNAVIRELAKGERAADGRLVVRGIVRTFELPLYGIALVLALVLPASAGFLAGDFLNLDVLGEQQVTTVLRLFAGIFVCRWLALFYRGVFFGLERQVRFNVIAITYASFRFIGGAALLVAGVVGIVGLFTWYLATDILYFAVLKMQVSAFERAGGDAGGRFSLPRLRAVAPYALGTMGLAVVGLWVTQFDKFLLARLRPVAELGAYSFAFAVAMGIRIGPAALWSAAFPRVVRCLQDNAPTAAAALLSAAFRVAALAGLALAAPLALFAPEFVALIGGGPAQVPLGAPLLAVLATGVFLETLNGASYHALLAAGDARALLRLNVVINAAFAVLLVFAVVHGGALGAALCWLPLQLATFAAYAWQARTLGRPVTAAALRRIAPGLLAIVAVGVAARWAARDVSPATGTAIAAALALSAHGLIAVYARRQLAATLLPTAQR